MVKKNKIEISKDLIRSKIEEISDYEKIKEIEEFINKIW